MKKMYLYIAGLMLSFGLSAQVVPPGSTEAEQDDSRREVGTQQGSNWDEDDLNKFVQDAALGSLLEIELSKLAQQKASSPEVKNFAEMLEKHHTDASKKLKDIAANLNIEIPAELDDEHKRKIENLQDLEGDKFDKEYIDLTVKNHKDDVSEFEKAQENVANNDLESWINNTLPVLKQHLETAENTQEIVEERI